MTGPVPPPLASAAVPAVGSPPLVASSPAPGQSQIRAVGPPIDATVVASTRQGPLIEAGGQRFLVSGSPPLPEGAGINLELTGTGRQVPARLLSVAGQVLEPPVIIRLRPAPLPASLRGPVESGLPAGGIATAARLLGPDGRPAGPPIPVRLAARGGPAPDTPGGRPAPGVAVLSAEVVGTDPTERLLLRASGLMLCLETAVDVPAGARLQLALPEDFLTRSGPPPSAAEDPLDRVLHALLRTAATGDPGGALGLRLPAADHALAARLLRWIDALGGQRSGAAAATRAGGPDAGPEALALRSALHDLGEPARTPQPGGWRVLVMPFGTHDPTPLRLYLRDPAADQERGSRAGREPRSGARRAIFAVELSELGRCQVDVLCQARRFDLAVRTERALATALQDDIRGLLAAACELAGVAGKVEFRAADLLSLPETPPSAGRVLIA